MSTIFPNRVAKRVGSGLMAPSRQDLPRHAEFTTRECQPSDGEFLKQLYVAIHTAEFASLGMPLETLKPLLLQQSALQEAGYRQQYPDADHRIIERNDEPVGRMIVDEGPEKLHIVDIALLPKCQRQGIGSALLQDVIDRAHGRAVRLHVFSHNPARQLYARMGFRDVSKELPYVTMEYPASPGFSG